MQVKLYRVLQEGKVRPLGSTEETDVDVRVIAATNRNLEKAIAEGRVSRGPVLPSERHSHSASRRCANDAKTFRCWRGISWSASASPWKSRSRASRRRLWRKLETYDWPGNVRELENTMERSVALETGSQISLRVLPDRVAGIVAPSPAAELSRGAGADFPETGVDFESEIAQAEKHYLQMALEKSDGVRTRAADLLKISYRSFRHYAKKHGL